MTNPKDLKGIANLLYEVGILAKTPRSGFYFLGSGEQSVAEHTHRNVYIGYALAKLVGDVDVGKVLQMCLFHDLAEGRTSDLNYVHQKYVESDESKVIDDLTATIPFGDDVKGVIHEYEERVSKESIVAKDADQIEFLLSLREEMDTGNSRAESWIPSLVKRLKTPEAQALAEMIIDTPSDEWWFGEKDDEWWVHRNNRK